MSGEVFYEGEDEEEEDSGVLTARNNGASVAVYKDTWHTLKRTGYAHKVSWTVRASTPPSDDAFRGIVRALAVLFQVARCTLADHKNVDVDEVRSTRIPIGVDEEKKKEDTRWEIVVTPLNGNLEPAYPEVGDVLRLAKDAPQGSGGSVNARRLRYNTWITAMLIIVSRLAPGWLDIDEDIDQEWPHWELGVSLADESLAVIASENMDE